MPALDTVRFRSNPFVELRQLASLTGEERERFRDLESDPDFYGLLIPRPPFGMNVKSVARQTADLFRALETPAPIDRALVDDEDAAGVVDLVLDGILEIESGEGFVSGADALSIVGASVPDACSGLSREALRHAQELETNEPQTLAMALYRYNHLPITRFWRTRFSGREAILAHVGADRGALRMILDRHWSLSGDTGGWLSWTPTLAAPPEAGQPAYKLYVSPRPERIRDAFEVLVRVLATSPATFKLGSSVAGLLRPDKLIAYFDTRGELDDAASRIRQELAGCDAHGLPFTAALDDSGLLSWGIDPPETERVLSWLQRQSWRYWVVQRLGGAMAVAKAARTAAAVEPWRFAEARIQRLGVDVETWTPSPALWRLA